MSVVARLVRVLFRQRRRALLGWPAGIGVLALATAGIYGSTYATAAEQQAAYRLSAADPALTALYVPLRGASNAAMFAWEMGTFLTLLAAVAGVLAGSAIAAEDDGGLEAARACGVSRSHASAAGVLVLAAGSVLFVIACAAGLLPHLDRARGFTAVGVGVLATAVGLTFWLTAALTVLLGQLWARTAATRSAAFAALGLTLGLRAIADTQDVAWLNGLSPLALRTLARPFAGNDWVALAIAAVVGGALLMTAAVVAGRREHGRGLLPPPDVRRRRLRVHSPGRLTVRLLAPTLAAWVVTIALLAGMFTALGSGVVEMSRNGTLDSGFLGSMMDGPDAAGGPVAAYLGYTGLVVGIVSCLLAVGGVLRAVDDERNGLSENLFTVGVGRSRPLAAQTGVVCAGALVALAAGGIASAGAASIVLDGASPWVAIGQMVGQWPVVVLCAGAAALVAGLLPRSAWLGWLVPVGGAALALLGTLFGLPQWAIDDGPFAQVPRRLDGLPVGLALLVSGGAVLALAGSLVTGRRDVVRG